MVAPAAGWEGVLDQVGGEVNPAKDAIGGVRSEQAATEQQQEEVDRLGEAEAGAGDAVYAEVTAEMGAKLRDGVVAVAGVSLFGGV